MFTKQQPVTNLQIIFVSDNSITIAWDKAPGAASSYIVFKPSSLPDQYYKVAESFTQVTSFTINDLAQGSEYAIKVFTGEKGLFSFERHWCVADHILRDL